MEGEGWTKVYLLQNISKYSPNTHNLFTVLIAKFDGYSALTFLFLPNHSFCLKRSRIGRDEHRPHSWTPVGRTIVHRKEGLTGTGPSLPTLGSAFDLLCMSRVSPLRSPLTVPLKQRECNGHCFFPIHPSVTNTNWTPSALSLLAKGT